MKYFLSFFMLFIQSVFAVDVLYAHIEKHQASFIDASAHLRFVNKETAPANQPWQIPGSLMGGEAFPVEKGMHFEDIQLHAVWVAEQYNLESRLSSHHGSEIGVENLFLSFFVLETLDFSAGKMDARFSSSTIWHAQNDHFSESPLLADVFFGGHFSDNGFRSNLKLKQFDLGIELWNGNAWPASSGEYSADMYLHHGIVIGSTKIQKGIWAFYAEPLLRTDQRYRGGHSHSNSNFMNNSDFFFSGQEKLVGAFVSLDWHITANRLLGFYLEFMQRESDGELSDVSRIAVMRSEHKGYISKLYFRRDNFTYAIRHEAMSFRNEFSSPAAAFIAADAGLVNNTFEPARTHLSVSKQLDAFTLRAETVSDKALGRKGDSRFSVSLIWQDTLWKHY